MLKTVLKITALFLSLLMGACGAGSTLCFAQQPADVSSAQEKPEAPKPKADHKVFFAGVSLLAASKAADAITTRQLLDRGGWENDPIFGRHPSPGTQAGINLGIFAGETAALYVTERNRHAWVRWAGRAFLAYGVVRHAQLAACNAQINAHAVPVEDCGRWF